MKQTIEIRSCTTLEAFDRCVELQRLTWGFADIELVPRDVIAVAVSTGGQLFGAYEGNNMIGFVLAFAAVREKRPYLHSHMLAVLPAYRNRGVGWLLKLRQRSDALARGLDLVEWTFDPLESKNAYFNLERLGAIVRRYVRNKYGRTTSPLHAGLPTDRLVAEWWLRSSRVEAVLAGERLPHNPDAQCVRVPHTITQLRKDDRAAAERLQSEIRAQFEKWFGQGYTVTGFRQDDQGASYLLERYEGEP